MNQAQSEIQGQKHGHSQLGAQAQKPLFLDEFVDEIDDPIEEDIDEYNNLEDYEIDEFLDYDDMSGDEDFEPEDDDSEEILIDIKNFPIAEINIFEDNIVISSNSRKKSNKQIELIISAIELIIETNKDYILRKNDRIIKIAQNTLVKKVSQDKSLVSRFLNNNYFVLPDGVSYCIIDFFSTTAGVKAKNTESIEKYIIELISEEKKLIEKYKDEKLPITKDLVYSDERISEECNKKFEKRDRKTIERLRKKLGIKSSNERFKLFLSKS